MKSATHIAICTALEAGVPSPIMNSDAPGRRLISSTTGTRTRNAPTMPCAITNRVCSQPV